MDTYFFDIPAKALMKAAFLLVTYIGSILFKTFDISIVLPTILIYFLSNISDYAELAFMRTDKVKKIRISSLWIFLGIVVISIFAFCIFTTENETVLSYANKFYYVFYILCATIWAIPLIDGLRGQVDEIQHSSEIISQQLQSDRAYQVMNESTSRIVRQSNNETDN